MKNKISLLVSLALVMTFFSCADSASSSSEDSKVFALVNIPFEKFFEEETNGKFDAYSSATIKAANGSITYGTYHKDFENAESASKVPSNQKTTGITYPVKINRSDLAVLKNLGGVEITDSTPFTDVTVSGRGGASTIRYEGKQNLYNNGDYSYYVLSQAPASYKDAHVSGQNISFGKIKGNTKTIDTLYVTVEPGEAHHEFSPMITLYIKDDSVSSSAGIGVKKLTFDECADRAKKVTVDSTTNEESFADQKLTSLRSVIATSTDGKSFGLTVLNNIFWGKSQIGLQAPKDALLPTGELADKKIASLKFVTEKEVYVAENIIVGQVADNVFYPVVSAKNNSFENTYNITDPTCFKIPLIKATDDKTERSNYTASFTKLEKADFNKEKLNGTYDELFRVINQSKYNSIWEAAVKQGKSNLTDQEVKEFAELIKSFCAASVYGSEAEALYTDPSSAKFDCFFINGISCLTYDGSKISGVNKKGSKVFEHEYFKVGEFNLDMGMDGILYVTLDGDAGEFKYFLMMPDTPDSTYHTEFRYGNNLDDLSKGMSGKYAYWLAAGIPSDATEDDITNVINLFVSENIAEEEDVK